MLFGKVKTALRTKTTAYDEEIIDLIYGAVKDLSIAGIDVDGVNIVIADDGTVTDTSTIEDMALIRAVITYCRVNFGSPENYDRLKASYDEQKAQMQSATAYTDWGEDE